MRWLHGLYRIFHSVYMARKTYAYRNGELVEVQRARPKPRAFYILSDEMPETWHPVTGQVMTSKSEFRKVTKAAGCEEVGDQALTTSAPRDNLQEIKQDVADAYNHLS